MAGQGLQYACCGAAFYVDTGKDCSLNYSGAFGYSFQKSDADTASTVALGFCREHGDACEIMITFSDDCAALATGHHGEASMVASVISNTKEEAQSLAVSRCQALGG